ncbi:hypothetical protein ACS0TY_029896 [Phlomoides rotata]
MLRKEFDPTSVTFISVLSACAHSGRVEDGERYFCVMSEKFKIEAEEEHYACMVDLLGRAGKVEEAKRLIETMPYNPNIMIWVGSLLRACRTYGNVEIAEKAANEWLELDSTNATLYFACTLMLVDGKMLQELNNVQIRARRERRVAVGLRLIAGILWDFW